MADDGKFNAWETADVTISPCGGGGGGGKLKNMESISVHSDYEHPPPTFTIIVAKSSAAPGDEVTITLGGKLALTGFLTLVQRSFDPNRNATMLQGRSKTADAIDCSINLKENNNGNFDGQKLQDFGSKVLDPYGIKFKVDGEDKEVEKVQVQPGESAYNFIERHCRQKKKYLIHDEKGDLQAIADPLGDAGGTVEEGRNIKSCNATISELWRMKMVTGFAQQSGTDAHWAKKASQIKSQTKPSDSECTRNRELTFVAERPMSKAEIEARTLHEAQYRTSSTIDVTVSVYGWLTGGDSGDLWKPGYKTKLKSKSSGVGDGAELWIRSATFTQSNEAGTMTTLELRNTPRGKVSFEAEAGFGENENPSIE